MVVTKRKHTASTRQQPSKPISRRAALEREAAREAQHGAELAARRQRYAAARAADLEPDPGNEEPDMPDTEMPAEMPWIVPNVGIGPPEHAVVEIETGGDVMKGRHVGGVWKMLGPDGKLIPQAVHVTRWRYIGKKVV